MNLNQLAKAVTKLEGKKKSLSIAQIKEVIACVGEALYLSKRPQYTLNRLMISGAKRHNKKNKK